MILPAATAFLMATLIRAAVTESPMAFCVEEGSGSWERELGAGGAIIGQRLARRKEWKEKKKER